jgi:chromate transport protein ChrA
MFSRHRAAFARHWRKTATSSLKLGTTAYGGPVVIGLRQAEFQEKRQWVPKERFLGGLSLVHMRPGATPMQLGLSLWHAHGRYHATQ